MKYYGWSILLKLLVLQCFTILCVVSGEFDFYYFVQQWPASYCDTTKSCCYPVTGKPKEDFGIHGLWPNNNDGSYPTECDSNNTFDYSQVVDLTSSLQENWPTLACPSAFGLEFWGHEWDKHGTCSETYLDQHSYFAYALQLKERAKTLQSLVAAGITPTDGKYYTLNEIKGAIKEATGFTPWIDCNKDVNKNHQLYQVYMCVDKTGLGFIECPVFPYGASCGNAIAFPSFSATSVDVL